MTPAAELRAAAALLRETAGKAVQGRPLPWTVGRSFKEWLIGSTDPERLVTSTGDEPVADWIALASPALAEPLAAWLDDAAENRRGLANEARALAVARAVSGRQP